MHKYIMCCAYKNMGVGQKPVLSILVGWTSIYQLFWGSLGAMLLTHSHSHTDTTPYYSLTAGPSAFSTESAEKIRVDHGILKECGLYLN